jgi:hypothetical protein
MRLPPVVACVLALSACGRGAGTAGPSDLAGGGGADGAAPATDAAPDLKVSRDTHPEIPPAEDAHREAIPMLEDAMLAGPCGAPDAKCPTYVGSTIWTFRSQSSVAASMGPDGAIYIGGSFFDSFDFDPTPQGMDVKGTAGQVSAFLMKLGPTGAYASTFTIPGDIAGRPQMGAPAVTATASFVPLYFEGTVDLDPGPSMDLAQDMLERGGSAISKFDASGKYVWGRVLYGTDSGLISWGGPVATTDGGVVLTGGWGGPVDLDPGPAMVPSPSQNGTFVTRLDASGKELWVRTLGGGLTDQCGMSAALDATGVLWVAGTTSGTCTFDQNGPVLPAPDSLFVASMSLDGKIRTFGTVTAQASLAGPPVVAHDGSIYLVGSVSGPNPGLQAAIDLDPSTGVSTQIVPSTGLRFVMKLDHDGKLVWLQPIDVDLSIFAASALTPDDGLVLASGWNGGLAGMTILRMDAGGNELWRLRAGGRGTRPDSVLVNATGFFVVGEQDGPGDLDPSTGVDNHDGTFTFLSQYTF